MNTKKNRVLGRVLAVEETRYVSGARSIGFETDPESDVTNITYDSNTCDDSGPQLDTVLCGTGSDIPPDPTPTDVLLDCATSNGHRDICIY
ncbi:MAG: hypothetical protein J0M09_18690 [Xanthomonadales bacterium]|jgi:hypothetical protein|nr:hypothetical protein [Xanthomonadales bacterium]